MAQKLTSSQEWQACEDPGKMFNHLHSQRNRRPLGLFVCACARSTLAWGKDAYPDANELDVIHRAEEMAEVGTSYPYVPHNPDRHIRKGIEVLASESQLRAANDWCAFTGRTRPFIQQQVAILHDLFGNPFLQTQRAKCVLVTCPQCAGVGSSKKRSSRTLCLYCYNQPVIHPDLPAPVYSLARAAYGTFDQQNRLESDRLHILADALEEAGCQREDIFTHLRSGNTHWRGCWALDWIRGYVRHFVS